jgi:hypothetical protein
VKRSPRKPSRYLCLILALAALGANAAANLPPVAQDDRAAVRDEGTRIDVLANDSDPDGDALTLSAVGHASKGIASIQTFQGRRWAFYKPAAGFSGEDSFSYTVRDGSGATAQATVTIYNTAPRANPVAIYPHFQRASALAEVGDPDGAGQALHVSVGPARYGKAEVYQRESIVGIGGGLVDHFLFAQVLYTPGSDFAGTDTFSYTVADRWGGKATAAVTVEDRMFGVEGNFFGTMRSHQDGKAFDEESLEAIFRIHLSRMGVATGVFLPWPGAFTARVDGKGHCRALVSIGRSPGMSFDIDPSTRELTGSLGQPIGEGEVATADIKGGQASYSAENPSPQAGAYTFAMNGQTTQHGTDQFRFGTGFGRMTVMPNGVVKLVGRLCDGAPFSVSSAIYRGNRCVLMASIPYGDYIPGQLTGELVFDPQSGDDAGGSFRFTRELLKPGQNPISTHLGYGAFGAWQASRYDPAAPLLQVTGSPNDVKLTFTFGAEYDRYITWSTDDSISTASAPDVTLRVDKQTGLFFGTFLNPERNRTQAFSGAILQRQNYGAGVFPQAGAKGAAKIVPQP